MTKMKSSNTFKEDDIRPDDLMQGQGERFAADVRRLLTYQDEFIDVPCPACGSRISNKAFEKYELTYVVCSDCNTMYVNPRPTSEILDMYYATSENYAYWNKYIFPASEKKRRDKIFRPRADKLADICARNGIKNGVLVEVGAGFGIFCEEIQRLGIFQRVIAVEPTPDLAETCRTKGLEVIEKPIEQIHFEPNEINVIATFEVIEHLLSPMDFLLSCASTLEDKGLLVITCPNVKGFDIEVLQSLSDSVDVEHLNYFNPKSLSHLVKECGLEILEIFTPGKLDAELVRKKILSGEFDASSQPFLKQVLVDEWAKVGENFQEFLSDNLLSSHMWLVARKPSGGTTE